MTRAQKLILIVFAVIDVVVVVALGLATVNSLRQPVLTPPPMLLAQATPTPHGIPTWTPTPTFTPQPTLLPRPTHTPAPTPTLFPTPTPTPLPTPGPYPIQNPEFDLILPNRIPGWMWDADINYRAGQDYDPTNSFAEPMFTAADDPARWINDSTLKIETMRWLKFRTWVYQVVTITQGSSLYFRIKADAFSSIERITVQAGVDPSGNNNCQKAVWGEAKAINQDDGIVTLTSPRVKAGAAGRVTLCFFAGPRYPSTNNAVFFDQAELIAAPPSR